MNDDLYVINLLFFQLKPLTNTKCYWSPYPDLTISRWSHSVAGTIAQEITSQYLTGVMLLQKKTTT